MVGYEDEKGEVLHGEFVGKFCKRRREELGITQDELAARMENNVSTNWVTQLETGRKRKMIPQPFLGWLAEGLAVSERELLEIARVLPPTGDEESEQDSNRVTRPSGSHAAILAMISRYDEAQAADTLTILRAMERIKARDTASAA
jgi:transcriptional regulator with XRE-family HTH domain